MPAVRARASPRATRSRRRAPAGPESPRRVLRKSVNRRFAKRARTSESSGCALPENTLSLSRGEWWRNRPAPTRTSRGGLLARAVFTVRLFSASRLPGLLANTLSFDTVASTFKPWRAPRAGRTRGAWRRTPRDATTASRARYPRERGPRTTWQPSREESTSREAALWRRPTVDASHNTPLFQLFLVQENRRRRLRRGVDHWLFCVRMSSRGPCPTGTDPRARPAVARRTRQLAPRAGRWIRWPPFAPPLPSPPPRRASARTSRRIKPPRESRVPSPIAGPAAPARRPRARRPPRRPQGGRRGLGRGMPRRFFRTVTPFLRGRSAVAPRDASRRRRRSSRGFRSSSAR